jgi:hypothetical protein
MARRNPPSKAWREGYRAALEDIDLEEDESIEDDDDLDDEEEDEDDEDSLDEDDELDGDPEVASIQRRLNRAVEDAYALGRDDEAGE